ncbi:hypothetical protein FPRO06_09318 [Fusarium proliferatum]|nr:hypothetical protein FPRO06_09318 [Fusarium proliferatum]
MGLEFEKGNAQRNSLFFTKLSPELRRQIFIYLFGESKVHIKFLQSTISLHLECPAVYDAHEGLCHLSTALPKSLLLQRLEVRMPLPGLGTHHGSSERDSQLMLRCLRMFLRGGLSKGKVELLALHLPEAMKEIVEGDKQVDATIWENVDCQFEQDNGPEGEEAKEEEDPESDDENHGLYIFPTQGDF